jgi:hypothetical protein
MKNCITKPIKAAKLAKKILYVYTSVNQKAKHLGQFNTLSKGEWIG